MLNNNNNKIVKSTTSDICGVLEMISPKQKHSSVELVTIRKRFIKKKQDTIINNPPYATRILILKITNAPKQISRNKTKTPKATEITESTYMPA